MATVQSIYSMLLASQYWPPEQMLAYQRTQLEQLLRHAKANVPFYATRLDCVFRKDGSIDWNRWEEIPIVTRADLRDRREEMQARVLPPGHGPTKSYFSSGSSGIPMEYTVNALSSTVKIAGEKRMRHLLGIPEGLRAMQYELKDGDLPNPADLLRESALPSRPHIDLSWDEETKLRLLQHYRVELFYGFATSVLLAARVNLTLPNPLNFRAVLTHGMGLTDEERDLIEQSFSCRCHSIYSSKECGLIAFTCPNSRNYHVYAENIFMEGGPASANEKMFTPLFTPLFNTAQPLIRYQQNDILQAASADNPNNLCRCDNCLPIFRTVHGRADTYFILNGTQVPILGIDDALLIRKLHAHAVQVAQTAADVIQIRFVGKKSASATARRMLTEHFCSLFKTPLKLQFRRMAELPTTSNGKINRYVREYQPAAPVPG